MKKVTKKELMEAFKALQAAKEAYKNWGEITERMIQAQQETIPTKEGVFIVVDKFAEKNSVWKPSCVNRFEIEFKKKVA